MNESDVREEIVRPFLHELGYQFGSEARIRTEVPLRYSRIFLGRKNPSKDPDVRGRADYVCERVGFGRFVVEVKGAEENLGEEDAQQAYTYAAHPEIAASFFLLTNGRKFLLFATARPSQAAFEWELEETEDRMPTLRNVIGPAALERRATLDTIDLGKPLADGLGSTARIAGGVVTYTEHASRHPLLSQQLAHLNGTRAAVTGGRVWREQGGQIAAELELAGPYGFWDAMNRAAGIELYLFRTAEEFVSRSAEAPTIFQGFTEGRLPPGFHIEGIPGVPPMTLPFGVHMHAYTEAVGFLSDERFKGMFSIDYQYRALSDVALANPILRLASEALEAGLSGVGEFDLLLQ